jgi:hypothetical protein
VRADLLEANSEIIFGNRYRAVLRALFPKLKIFCNPLEAFSKGQEEAVTPPTL